MKNCLKFLLFFAIICLIFIRKPAKSEEFSVKRVQKGGTFYALEIELIIEEEEPIINYRLTSFWSNDGYGTGSCTGSGLCEGDFGTNEFGWYVYDGKIVLAGATTYLQKSYGTVDGRHYFKYYDEIDVIIDGVSYRGIILDSCGACMTVSEDRLDLFVSGSSSSIDRGYRGVNMIGVNL